MIALLGNRKANKAIKFVPYGRRTLVPRAVYCQRYLLSFHGGYFEKINYWHMQMHPVAA